MPHMHMCYFFFSLDAVAFAFTTWDFVRSWRGIHVYLCHKKVVFRSRLRFGGEWDNDDDEDSGTDNNNDYNTQNVRQQTDKRERIVHELSDIFLQCDSWIVPGMATTFDLLLLNVSWHHSIDEVDNHSCSIRAFFTHSVQTVISCKHLDTNSHQREKRSLHHQKQRQPRCPRTANR